jgi:hypothetical protein
MDDRLDALKRRFGRDAPEVRQEISGADREILRALGYAEESPSFEGEPR